MREEAFEIAGRFSMRFGVDPSIQLCSIPSPDVSNNGGFVVVLIVAESHRKEIL